MKAVVLAAGAGTRLRPSGREAPKVLYPLLGLPIIKRAILGLKAAGIREVLVVTGCLNGLVEGALSQDGVRGVDLKFLFNPQWPKGNGLSLYVAREELNREERFLVVMGDHLFDPVIVTDLLSAPLLPDTNYLVTDFDTAGVPTLSEATKVRVDPGGRISSVGREVGLFNGVDCGIFSLTRSIFGALESAFSEGRYDLSSAVQLLAARGQMVAFPVGGRLWHDVDTEEDVRQAGRKLSASLRSPGDGLVARHMNRYLSQAITRMVAGWPLTPNHWTFISFGVGLLSAVAFAWKLPLWGGLLAQFSSVLDGVDGEVARATFQTSPFGTYLDSILDRYADAFILLGMGIYAYWQMPGPLVLAVLFLSLVGAPLSMVSRERFLTAYGRVFVPERDDGWARYLLATRDGRLFIIMLGGLLHLVVPALIWVALTTSIQVVHRIVLARRVQAQGPEISQ